MPMLGQIETRPALNPDPAVAKATAFHIMGYKIHAKAVRDYHASTAPVRIVSAPARTSKSYSAAADAVAMALPTVPLTSSLTWSVGPTYAVNREFQEIYTHLVEHRERWKFGGWKLEIEKAQNSPQHGQMLIQIYWGKDEKGHPCRAVIEGKSATNPEALQGEHVSNLILSEAAEHPESVWTKYLSTRYSWASLPTTPKPQAAWIRTLIEHGENDPSLGIEHFTYPPDANPHYDFKKLAREEKLAAQRSRTGEAKDDPYFAEQFMGRWVYYTGRVLPFEESRHVRPFDPRWLMRSRIFVSCDYGYEDACVALFWAILPTGALLLYDEIYTNRLTSSDFVLAIEKKIEPVRHRLDYITGDPKQPQVEAYLRRYGLPICSIDKHQQSDRALGTRKLVDLLSVPAGGQYPQLFVADTCPRTIAEWKHLRYKEGHTNEYGAMSLVGADHAFDAARYGIMTIPTLLEDEEPPDWLEYRRREDRQMRFAKNPRMTQMGLGRWAETGRSPYA